MCVILYSTYKLKQRNQQKKLPNQHFTAVHLPVMVFSANGVHWKYPATVLKETEKLMGIKLPSFKDNLWSSRFTARQALNKFLLLHTISG